MDPVNVPAKFEVRCFTRSWLAFWVGVANSQSWGRGGRRGRRWYRSKERWWVPIGFPQYLLLYLYAFTLLVVRPCGTVYQLHFDWTRHCLYFIHVWKHFWWHKYNACNSRHGAFAAFFEFAPYTCKWLSFIYSLTHSLTQSLIHSFIRSFIN